MHAILELASRTTESERSLALMLLAFVAVMYFGRQRAR